VPVFTTFGRFPRCDRVGMLCAEIDERLRRDKGPCHTGARQQQGARQTSWGHGNKRGARRGRFSRMRSGRRMASEVTPGHKPRVDRVVRE
jgi:hypothetical protein